VSRRIFGWDLPPGCTHRQIEEQYGGDRPCPCCGILDFDCECSKCPVCEVVGDPKCYTEHGMKYSKQQLIGQAKLRIQEHQAAIEDEKIYIDWVMSDGDM